MRDCTMVKERFEDVFGFGYAQLHKTEVRMGEGNNIYIYTVTQDVAKSVFIFLLFIIGWMDGWIEI